MAWERRGKRMYYYRSRKIAGRVVREYVGTGEIAEIAARLDALAGVQRAARQAAIDEIDEMERVLAPAHELVEAIVWIVMTQEGYHMSRGKWRKKQKQL